MVLLSLALNFLAVPIAALAANHLPPATPAQTTNKIADESAILAKVAGPFNLGGAFMWGINIMLTGVLIFESRFVAIAGYFFDSILLYTFGSFKNLVAIQIGWTIARDASNIFFIIILLIIAIATILRVQNYNSKALLPKLIVMALLINFSLSMGFVLIDFSNLMGIGFYKELTRNGSISQALMRGTAFQQIFNTDNITAKEPPSLSSGMGSILASAGVASTACVILTLGWCLGAIGLGSIVVTGTYGWQAITGGDVGLKNTMEYFYTVLIPIIYAFPLIFVLVFGAILLVIRVAILSFLLILAPLAFLFYILPATEKHWHTWWEKFMSHAFFLPAFMFLLYISMSIANQMALATYKGAVQNLLSPFLINMSIIVVFLISSLLIARTMGIYFAGTVLGWASSSRKGITGFVGRMAARNTLAPIGERLKPLASRITQASPWLGTYARGAQEWLAKRGGAREMAEDQAKAALAQAKGTWGASFGKLGLAGRATMLRNMTPEQRAEFLESLPQKQREVADNMLRSPQFTAAEAAKFDLESWKRQTAPEQRAQISQWLATNPKTGLPNNPETATEALRSMNDDERANLVDSLAFTDPALAKQAIGFIESQFSPKDQQNFKIARLLRKTDDEQHAKFATELKEDDRETFLRKKDAKGQARFMDDFAKPAPAGVTAADWTAAKTAAESTIQTRFSAGEQRAFKEAVIENTSGKSVDKIKTAAATMSDEELDILQKTGDENKISQLINDFSVGTATADQKVIAQKIGKSIVKRGQENKYIDRVTPRAFIENVAGVAYKDLATDPAGYANYQKAMEAHFAKVDAKALRKNLSPNIIKQKEFVEDVLTAGTIEDISLITGDARRAAAFKEGWETTLGLKSTANNRERAESLAKEMENRKNNIVAQELRDHIARSQALAAYLDKKGDKVAAQELRDNLASDSPSAAVLKSILEGRAQPQIK
ncbi:MAG: hypothetical protein UW81_C0007G0007 [Candidatus Giovannonibacteria bacterium GW2011_GWC2_44_9]|uniref:Uncharacterized protein n=2 Tax=Candidatus Giovannoniibacteriota TaxID=1752738 RepID=A0A0G1IWZ4_9BACT|nr:MAG: hypothetical protein UW57_C0006G0015 [Candidatus Giovannonibacteria bacterium GW2011_GWA1_44_29]KKT84012.1 MAG: hypothetical protein UW81_C0007G0007 [Candidatus Giovannonibacteria bacterium GW2011_GWC2_44_9]KKT91276.1 MAG: hypothetical protein UW93_C0009G0007 [Parcubacteria group bacterium GW2011_GWC1_45_13]KKU29799.1 MAG: hypothetical protein UX43_C0005G0007 [Candidatus Giovannonibacteria bacterium GW2011_GWB1_46_20]